MLGEKLKDHEIVKKLRTEMMTDNATNNCRDSVHYYVIDSCSGSGKSLLCFSLKHEDLKVIHLVLNAGDNQQEIYKSLEPRSGLLKDALLFDKDVIGQEVEKLSCAQLLEANHESALVSFIMKAIDSGSNGSQVKTLKDLKLQIVEMRKTKLSKNIPVFFIDEAVKLKDENGSMSDNDSKTLRYIRNTFRCAGIYVVLMGTNSSMANFVPVSTASGSRSSGEVRLWCKVRTQLPKVTNDTLAVLQSSISNSNSNSNSNSENKNNKEMMEYMNRNHKTLFDYLKMELLCCNPFFVWL